NGLDMLRSFGQRSLLNPIQMNIPHPTKDPNPEGVQPLNHTAYACDDDNLACSCVDCPKMCTLDFPDIPEKSICYVGSSRLECITLGVIIVYSLLLFLLLTTLVLYKIPRLMSRKRRDPAFFTSGGPSDDADSMVEDHLAYTEES